MSNWSKNDSICFRLQIYRKSNRISQADLAELMGVSRRKYQRMESGESPLMVQDLLCISEILKIPIQSFFNEIEDLLKKSAIAHTLRVNSEVDRLSSQVNESLLELEGNLRWAPRDLLGEFTDHKAILNLGAQSKFSGAQPENSLPNMLSDFNSYPVLLEEFFRHEGRIIIIEAHPLFPGTKRRQPILHITKLVRALRDNPLLFAKMIDLNDFALSLEEVRKAMYDFVRWHRKDIMFIPDVFSSC